jgi:hypothetical protein
MNYPNTNPYPNPNPNPKTKTNTNTNTKPSPTPINPNLSKLNIKSIAGSYWTLPPIQRLYVSLGFFGFALAGIYVSNKLEEAFPSPGKQKALLEAKTESESDSAAGGKMGSGKTVKPQSLIDLLDIKE